MMKKFNAVVRVVLFLLVSCCSPKNDKKSKKIEPQRFQDIRTKYGYELIDVRTLKETKEGMIEGAIQIDFFSKKLDSILNDMDKSKTYMLYCKSGGRSGKMTKLMHEKGFQSLIELKGGYLRWKAEGFEVTKPDSFVTSN